MKKLLISMKSTFFFCLFLSLLFFACKEKPVEIEYTISPTSLNFDATGGEDLLTVSVKTPATIESIKVLDTWCQVSQNGVSPVNVAVTVAPNTDETRKTQVVINMKSGETKVSATVEIIQEGADWVLIDGIKWATRNVDAPGTFAANAEDAGMFYQWNKKLGWSATNPMINSNGGTVWDGSNAEGGIWDKANDPCPAGWRVPTNVELGSLISADRKWTTLNGVNGCMFGSDEPFLFLPAVGSRNPNNGNLNSEVGMIGYYWSSNISGIYACRLVFGNRFVNFNNSLSRAYGFSVRCVAE